VFEFSPAKGTAGEGSSFGDALDMARFLSGDRLSQVRTVAWLPRSVKGHAVLAVLACEEIMIGKGAEFGAAGSGEPGAIDDTLRRAYTEIAERRRTVPAAIALGLLDKDLAVSKVILVENKAVRFETAGELQKLREKGAVAQEETLFQPGDPHVLSGARMRELGLASHVASDRRALAGALQIPLTALRQDMTPEDGWKAIRVDLHGPIHRQSVNWILRSLDDHQRRGDFNLLLLSMNTGGGDIEQSRRLAEHLAAMGQGIYRIAFVGGQARSDAALVALSCDELVMQPDAMLGGPGETTPSEGDLDALRPGLIELFGRQGRDWSLPVALVDSRIEVHRYHHPLGAEVRYLSAAEAETLAEPADWQRDNQPIATAGGISGVQAEQLGLARAVVNNLAELKALYHIDVEPQPVRPNWALAFVEWLADPRIAGVLLFVGGFALLFELSTPGVGVPGFVAVVCFLLFFWSQFLHGTSGWLEILLFVGGVMCIAVELFALPGFGVFGFGGALMVVASIVLASQTFVIPTNAYQLRQFPISLLMMAAGMAGGIVSVAVIRRFLPDTPYFNRMLLNPPGADERAALSRREALVTWEHLLNKRGETTTPLVPAGKAQFGDELIDVISNGELIAKGTPVIVEDVTGNRVVVRKVNL
jgi:membrane-bound ClpP family serine protease